MSPVMENINSTATDKVSYFTCKQHFSLASTFFCGGVR